MIYFSAMQNDRHARLVPTIILAPVGETFDDFPYAKNNFFMPELLDIEDLVDAVAQLLSVEEMK